MGRFILLDPGSQQGGTTSRPWSALTRREFFAVMTASAGALLASACGSSDDTEAQVSDGTAASNSDASVSTQAASAAATAAPTAAFVGTDSVTLGSWKGVYGADGATIVGDSEQDPAYAPMTSSGASTWIWAQSTNNSKALMKAASTDRIAACWYAPASFTIDVNMTDAQSHRIAFYCIDWSAAGRVQTIDVLDPATGSVLDTRTVSSFAAGVYLIWNISGHVRFRLSRIAGPNAIVNGVFFGGATTTLATPPPPPPPTPTYNISVSWTTPLLNTDGSSLTDITGYVVRYGTSPSNLSQSLRLQGAGVTSATISGLPAGTYYIAVATVNSAGITSDVSNAASKTVP
jgi:hypothetical protein